MKYTTTATLLAAATTLANAQSLESPSPNRDPVERACNPSNSSGLPDFNAPCNAVKAIEYQCIYGPAYLQQIISETQSDSGNQKRQSNNDNNNGDDKSSYGTDGSQQMQSNSTQRTCICESQFFDQVQGCSACYKAHGSSDFDEGILDTKGLASLSSSYCAASATPSVGLADFLFQWANDYNSSHPATASATSSMSDSIGNKTAVSLYYTPSVTGSAAWVIAEATSGASSGLGTFKSQNTVDGIIQPTASANNDAAQTSGSDSNGGSDSSSSSTGGAPVATAAGVGMLGLAGLVAML